MTLRRIVQASRPLLWTGPALIYLVGAGKFSNLSLLAIIELWLFTFPLNFYLYGLNDAYDIASDRLNNRKDGVQGIVASDPEVRLLKRTVWIPALAVLVVALFGGLQHFLLVAAFVALAFAYSHPLLRFKEVPIVDCFTSAAIYSLPGLIAYSLHAPLATLPSTVYFVILIYAGVHATSTLEDMEVDARAGMRTVAVALGRRGTAAFAAALFLISLLIFRTNPVLVAALLVALFVEFTYIVSSRSDENYFRFAAAITLIALYMFCAIYFILQANWA